MGSLKLLEEVVNSITVRVLETEDFPSASLISISSRQMLFAAQLKKT